MTDAPDPHDTSLHDTSLHDKVVSGEAWHEFCEANEVTYDYLCWGFYEVAVRLTSIRGASIS